MNAPNLISLARVLLVPFIILLIISGEFKLAFVLMLLAGLTEILLAPGTLREPEPRTV